LTLKIRDGEFNTITRAAKLEEPTNLTQPLWETAREVFDKWAATTFKPLRLLGVQATQLTSDVEQLGLFDDSNRLRQKRVDQTVDRINARFGTRTIRRGKWARESDEE